MCNDLIPGHVGGRIWRRDELVIVAPGWAVPRVARGAYQDRRARRFARRIRLRLGRMRRIRIRTDRSHV